MKNKKISCEQNNSSLSKARGCIFFIFLMLGITLFAPLISSAEWDYTGNHFDTYASGCDDARGIAYWGGKLWLTCRGGTLVDDIATFYTNGTFITSFDISASNTDPHGIGINDTWIWTTESSTDDMHRYNHAGALQQSYNISAKSTVPMGLTHKDGYLYVADAGDSAIEQYEAISGTWVSQVKVVSANLRGVFYDSNTNLFYTNHNDTGCIVNVWNSDWTFNTSHSVEGVEDRQMTSNITDYFIVSNIQDEVYIYDSARVVVTPTITNLTLTLTYPSTGTIFYSVDGSNFDALLNITGTNSEGYAWKNITYYLYKNDVIFNITTNTSLSGTDINSTLYIDSFVVGNYKWDTKAYYGNATFNNFTWSNNGNFTFQVIPFSVTSYNFTQNVYETSRQQYNLVLETLGSVTSVSARFKYNGTYYDANVIDIESGNYNITNYIDVPLAQHTGNKELNWDFTFTFTGGSTLNQSGTTYYQNVSQIHLSLCNATYKIPYINFSIHSATNPFPVINATFKSAWAYWIGNGNVKKNMSYEDVSLGNNTWDFCMSPVDKTYNVNTHVETDATGYSLNNYYLDEAKLTNTTNLINLYLLNDSLSTLTVLKVINPSQQPLEDVTIQVQLYDVGTDTFYTVAMAKTSYNGEDLVYLNWYDSLYKFIFIQNGQVVKTVDPFRISETPQIFTIEGDTTFTYQKFIDMAYSLTYNNVTKNFILTFTKPSSTVDTGCLRVIKREATSDIEICNACETSSSATLYCNIAAYGNGTYIATFYATGSFWSFGSLIETVGGNFASSIYDLLGNDDATFYAMIFSGIVVFLMFINLPLGILGVLLGIVGGAALGFQVMAWGTYISIVIIGGMIIWFVKK